MKRRFFIFTMLVANAGMSVVRAANAADQPAPPAYEFKLQKTEDSIAVKTDDKRTVLVVASASGIGSATVALRSGQWPKHIGLRFEYPKGREFTLLEGFSITTSRLRVQDAAHSAKSRCPFIFWTAKASPTPLTRLPVS